MFDRLPDCCRPTTFAHRLLAMALLLLAIPLPLALADQSSGGDAERQRPNIVFIFSDDLTCQAISAYGEARKLLQTPHMDRIAREGMRFDRCMVTNSICGPSRATVLTGLYSHKNGFFNNTNSRFDGQQQTFPKLLQKAGYQTALIGKWHLVSEPTGFDHWQILPGQGIYYNPPMNRMGEKLTEVGYVTDRITDLSLEWLDKRDPDKPFLLMLQHKAPHREWAPPIRHLGFNGDQPFAEPPTLFDDLEGRQRAVKDHDMGIDRTFTDLDAKLRTPTGMRPKELEEWNAYYASRNQAFIEKNLQGKELIKWRYQRYMHDYLGCVKAVDESVGRVLEYLDQHGLAENTLVVCTSDQGFFLGEHGWFDKRWIFEESARTPLLVRWPGVTRPGSHSDRIVSLIDFAPTFLDAAGVQPPQPMQGSSLRPLLADPQGTAWRDALYYHYYEYPAPHRVQPHRGVITERYKLVHYYTDGDSWELLDRWANPEETRSFYADPQYAAVVQDLKERLEGLRTQVDDRADPPQEAFGNQPFPKSASE